MSEQSETKVKRTRKKRTKKKYVPPSLHTLAIANEPIVTRPVYVRPEETFILSEWSYETPLEAPPDGVFLNTRVIEINGMSFQARSDCHYKYNYYDLLSEIEEIEATWTLEERKKQPLKNRLNLYRNLLQDDLFFLVFFALKNPLANHPFIIEACKEIESERGDSLEVWARDHLKTTIISLGRQIQKVLNNPEKRIAYFSATRPLAIKILSAVRTTLEQRFLRDSFPDILYSDPRRESPSWTLSTEGGLTVKRSGIYKEPTFTAWGLLEGMPTGDHYTDMVFDDIVNQDHQSPEIIEKVCDNFDMAGNIGERNCQVTVIGTFYRHDDPLVYIRDKRDIDTGEPLFRTRRKTATIDGSFNGASVFLPEKTLQKKRAGRRYIFYCQQLLDPTPKEAEKLNRDHVKIITRKQLPLRLYRFMAIDAAGDEGKKKQRREPDDWAMVVVGVEPFRDDLGFSRIIILDLLIARMNIVEAQQAAVQMYARNGRILKLGIEKVGISSTEIHICAALRAKGKYVSLENNNLEILRPSGRSKEFRIESNLAVPLKNGKIEMLDTVPVSSRERLFLEMEKFPRWKDDGLDACSYIYDMVKGYRFGVIPEDEQEEDIYDRALRKQKEHSMTRGWTRA